jgi:uncharacterized protein (TIGR02145 family)
VAQVNNSGDCGNLASRKNETLAAQGSRADFTNTLTRNQAYTFTPSGTVSNVRFYAVEAGAYTGRIVESLTGGNPGNSITSAVTCSIIYKDNLNGLASGKTNADALTVDIFVVYNDNATNTGTDKRLKLTATIKDCACCGAFTTSGTWLSFMCYNLGADSTLTTPDQIKNAPTSKTWGYFYNWGKRKPWPSSGSVSGWINSNNTTDIDGGGGNGNANAWGAGGPKTAADPCPAGWRVPSIAQWKSLYQGTPPSGTGGTIAASGWSAVSSAVSPGVAMSTTLYLPYQGHRHLYSGNISTAQGKWIYWARDASGSINGWTLGDHGGGAFSDGHRGHGVPVRCVAE